MTRQSAPFLVFLLFVASCAPKAAEQVASSTSRAATPNPWAELSRLDERKPVPQPPPMADHMRRDMRDHLAVVQQVVAGLASDDFDKAAKAAGRLARRPGQAEQCEHMGAGAAGFTERALGLHDAGDALLSALNKGDKSAALSALSTTLQSCTSCHAQYRQELVSMEEYERRTGHAMAPMHH